MPNTGTDLNAMNKAFKKLVGENYEWKIGDMDGVLGGNMNKTQGKGKGIFGGLF